MTEEATEIENDSTVSGSRQERLVIRKSDIQQLQSKLKQYVEKENPEKYSADTIIKDVIYFLGISIDPKFAFANGFDEFKKHVKKALDV